MCNPWHRHPLVERNCGEQRPGRDKQNLIERSRLYFFQIAGTQSNRRAATAGAPGTCVLFLGIIDLNPAVCVHSLDIVTILPEQID